MEKNIPPFNITKEQGDEVMNRQPHLAKQTFEQISNLDASAHHVISRQATVNIGTIGHVAHGKTTVVKAISGVHTVKFQKEKVRNITIFLGYANAKIFKCPKCPAPKGYVSFPSHQADDTKCAHCGEKLTLVRHVSFVDCPGHDVLMATMLTGAAVMDAALLLIAGNMPCPQPQTSEHLAAVDIMKLNHIIILQNKVDLIFKDERAAVKNHEEIKSFIQGTRAENSPIIPVSAQLRYNIDAVCQYICEYIPTPVRDFYSEPELIIIRSFDINRPGEETDDLKGGVAGGSILKGVLRIGDEIEIRPGIVAKDAEGKIECNVLRSKIISLLAEKNDLLYAIPGGLIGCGLLLDPALTKSNRLVGNVLGYPDKLPEIYQGLEISYHLLRRLVGVKSDAVSKSDKVRKAAKGEVLMINVGSNSTGGRVESVSEKSIKLTLIGVPICARIDEKVSLSRKIENKWRLIGWGTLKKGKTVTPKVK